MFELIFLKILLQISIFLLQTVPKRYTSIQYTVKNLVILIFKPPRSKKLLFLIRPNPKKFQICNGGIYEIWLTLLCETMTYFNGDTNQLDQGLFGRIGCMLGWETPKANAECYLSLSHFCLWKLAKLLKETKTTSSRGV